MKYILLTIRDYHIVSFRKRGDSEDEVYSNTKQAMVAWFAGWYVAFLAGVAVISHKLGFRPVFDHSLLTALIVGLLLLTPYVLVMWAFTERIMHFPELVNEVASPKKSAWIAWSIVLIGLLMIGIVPIVLEAIVPVQPPR
ncbi:hypothetical protein [Fibrella aquatica]|jgi:hypothetical protein|uniref:hypothetical protein n=1 Tax=Fibrella aquatica TaxID=3242487 RepID=UPI0035214A15